MYVLELNNPGAPCFYVGQSRNMAARIAAHRAGKGAAFCKAKGGVKAVHTPLTPAMDNLLLWEQQEVLARMVKHGFNNVRGWEFTSCDALSRDECATIRHLILGSNDLCRVCGTPGHFAKDCHNPEKAEWLKELEAGEHPPTTWLWESWDMLRGVCARVLDHAREATRSGEDVCFRCGRAGHWRDDCYAKRHADGHFLG